MTCGISGILQDTSDSRLAGASSSKQAPIPNTNTQGRWETSKEAEDGKVRIGQQGPISLKPTMEPYNRHQKEREDKTTTMTLKMIDHV